MKNGYNHHFPMVFPWFSYEKWLWRAFSKLQELGSFRRFMPTFGLKRSWPRWWRLDPPATIDIYKNPHDPHVYYDRIWYWYWYWYWYVYMYMYMYMYMYIYIYSIDIWYDDGNSNGNNDVKCPQVGRPWLGWCQRFLAVGNLHLYGSVCVDHIIYTYQYNVYL